MNLLEAKKLANKLMEEHGLTDWKFKNDVIDPDTEGLLLEIPIYTKMVPFWEMYTTKRVGLQQKASSSNSSFKLKIYRLSDFLRFQQPLNFHLQYDLVA